jgi:catechol 2,3-dioxygenase-like lactoylglutathione lyase family enzyme
MIKSKLGHVQFNVYPHNLAFYQALFAFLGWPTLEDSPTMLGVGSSVFESLWFFGGANDSPNDYDGRGMNHIGLLVYQQADVDRVAAFLEERGIPLLFDTPRHRPEFSYDADHTYYQVMFESPDRILFEVVYMSMPENNPFTAG